MFRKLYMELCGGKELSTSIEHPLRSKERLFLLFDFTHNLKNMFNNFVTRKRYHVPEIANANAQHILGGECLAQFEHINRLYALEEHKPLRIAFTLKKASLNPSNIARTSPQHASSNWFCFILVHILSVCICISHLAQARMNDFGFPISNFF